MASVFSNTGYRKYIFVAVLDIVLIAGYLLSGTVAKWMLNALPDCYIASKGLPCPSCGGTRAVLAISNGNIAEAFSLNGSVALLVIYIGVLVVIFNLEVFTRSAFLQKVRSIMTHHYAIIAMTCGYVAFGILRYFL
ncbi:MAG: DUF2752 domain-containing protein [Clostridia bacterium]|nr:DUF2752 domain-containing protein [Clostridia bacterium]